MLDYAHPALDIFAAGITDKGGCKLLAIENGTPVMRDQHIALDRRVIQ